MDKQEIEKMARVLSTRAAVEEANNTPVLKTELLRVIQEVDTSTPESRDWEGHAITAVRLFEDADKVKAIMFRLDALVSLLTGEGAPGWTLVLPNGAVLTQEAVFAATAMEPLIESEGQVAFDRERFLDRVLEIADLDEIA
jgi:hypothetical protein